MTASGASGNGHHPSDAGNGHHLPDAGNGHHVAGSANGHHEAESGNGLVPHPVSGGPIVQLPTAFGDFVAQAWTDLVTGAEHLAVSSPNPPKDGQAPLVRLHSECLTGDVFGSYRCDCGEQLAYALEMIREHGGTLLYLRGQEGRGIGLANKIKAYALQEAGFDTVEANEQLGLPVDARCYKAAAQVLAEMGLHEVRLLSNNPDKQNRLAKAGVKVVEMVPTEVPSRDQNIRYLQTKKDRMEHRLVLDSHVGGPVPVTTPDTSFGHEQD